jgi:uncharacterized membrane protein YgcG
MPGPKKKSLKKQVREIEDNLGVDSTVEDIVDGILSIFDTDEESDDSDDSIFESDSSDTDTDDSDNDDFGGGDFGGGGASSDW